MCNVKNIIAGRCTNVRLISVVEGVNWVIGVSDTDTVDGIEELEELKTIWVRFNEFDNESIVWGGFEKKDCSFHDYNLFYLQNLKYIEW